ncbi:MAG: peptidylprolyl isomerase [Mycobacteriaceae bacterium]|nr:peptidylprolyl isomerase [Mycobacteriaceae bacterium]
MPTNEQRRATAKRKLERQLERRAAKERQRRIFTIVGSVVGVLVIAGGVAAAVILTGDDSDSDNTAATGTSTTTSAEPTGPGTLPAFAAPAGLGDDCQYPASAEKASKDVKPPRTGKVPTDPAQVSASMETNQGNIGLMLDNGKSPCTVNSFASLANQGFFNDTTCHRLTTSDSLSVLQCGDPTAQGTGGPGYQFPNEYPTNQYQPDDPRLAEPVLYPRGTLAMANAGPGTNGSQFFLVYKDSQLPPGYTVFGTIDETGLATLDKIAAAGTADGAPDGSPKSEVKITKLQLDP